MEACLYALLFWVELERQLEALARFVRLVKPLVAIPQSVQKRRVCRPERLCAFQVGKRTRVVVLDVVRKPDPFHDFNLFGVVGLERAQELEGFVGLAFEQNCARELPPSSLDWG